MKRGNEPLVNLSTCLTTSAFIIIWQTIIKSYAVCKGYIIHGCVANTAIVHYNNYNNITN